MLDGRVKVGDKLAQGCNGIVAAFTPEKINNQVTPLVISHSHSLDFRDVRGVQTLQLSIIFVAHLSVDRKVMLVCLECQGVQIPIEADDLIDPSPHLSE